MILPQVGDTISLLLSDMGAEGEAVGHFDGMAVFVWGGVPGDRVTVTLNEVHRRYSKGRLMGVQNPSPDRVIPRCEWVGQCGGCQLQQWEYSQQLAWKQQRVERMLQSMPVHPMVGMVEPWHYRNKALLPIHASGMGFYAKWSHDVIPITTCVIQSQDLHPIVQAMQRWMVSNGLTGYDETHQSGEIRGILCRQSESELVLIVVARCPLNEVKGWGELANINGVTGLGWMLNQADRNRMVDGPVVPVMGSLTLTHQVGGLTLQVPAPSFFQINHSQYTGMMEQIRAYLQTIQPRTVWDLYAGVGGFGILAATLGAQVQLAECDPQAMAIARHNAELNHCASLVGVASGDAAVLMSEWATATEAPDCVILDPPRKGCSDAMIQALLTHLPEWIIYISCDVATLSRDLKRLMEAYECLEVRPFDMFPHTVHIECITCLHRRHV